MLAAVIAIGGAVAFAQSARTATVEVRVWQKTEDAQALYISARPEGGSWATLGTIPLDMSGINRNGTYRYGDILIAKVDVRVWQNTSNAQTLYISARPEGASWADGTGTIPITMSGISSSGKYRYGDTSVMVAPPADARVVLRSGSSIFGVDVSIEWETNNYRSVRTVVTMINALGKEFECSYFDPNCRTSSIKARYVKSVKVTVETGWDTFDLTCEQEEDSQQQRSYACFSDTITAVCPQNYQNAGESYTFSPKTEMRQEAAARHCGRQNQKWGSWRSASWSDDIDRTLTYQAVSLIGKWIGNKSWIADPYPSFYIRCSSKGEFSMFIAVGGYVSGRNDNVSVVYSFDQQNPIRTQWSESSNNESVFMRSMINVIAALRHHSESDFRVRIYEYDGSVYGTASFNITGIERQVEPVLAECGW